MVSNASIDNENHGSAISTAMATWNTTTRAMMAFRAVGFSRANGNASWMRKAAYVDTARTTPISVSESLSTGNGRNSGSCNG
jgi:hypothetical protein